MEFANFTVIFLELLALFLFLSVLFEFVFKNKKVLISVLRNFILLVFINFFVISQHEYMFENFRKYAYGMWAMLFLMYFIFIRDLYSYINSIKSERASIKE
ncbi:hypothetical protein M3649_15880 [Ureibacillus chungkukjangi]|uniref:hypothetical protein n=1 Tax=Ureibacillus chungkukjangi TaxID=1202712 RepID=UPI00203C824F|nr:hypothetical protein [Ureibacillus chungkukjangi]MCM3389606.1 hypothetical protein [Ureibacillus chungkukjangi]